MKFLTLIDGKKTLVDISASDFLSGVESIPASTTLEIAENSQSINFTALSIIGDLVLIGDLWLA